MSTKEKLWAAWGMLIIVLGTVFVFGYIAQDRYGMAAYTASLVGIVAWRLDRMMSRIGNRP